MGCRLGRRLQDRFTTHTPRLPWGATSRPRGSTKGIRLLFRVNINRRRQDSQPCPCRDLSVNLSETTPSPRSLSVPTTSLGPRGCLNTARHAISSIADISDVTNDEKTRRSAWDLHRMPILPRRGAVQKIERDTADLSEDKHFFDRLQPSFESTCLSLKASLPSSAQRASLKQPRTAPPTKLRSPSTAPATRMAAETAMLPPQPAATTPRPATRLLYPRTSSALVRYASQMLQNVSSQLTISGSWRWPSLWDMLETHHRDRQLWQLSLKRWQQYCRRSDKPVPCRRKSLVCAEWPRGDESVWSQLELRSLHRLGGVLSHVRRRWNCIGTGNCRGGQLWSMAGNSAGQLEDERI